MITLSFRENEGKLREWLEMVGMPDARRSLETMAYDKEKFPLLILIAKDHGSYNIIDICAGMQSWFLTSFVRSFFAVSLQIV